MGAPAANGVGQLLFLILVFVFYVSFDMGLGFRSPVVLPVAAQAELPVRVKRKT